MKPIVTRDTNNQNQERIHCNTNRPFSQESSRVLRPSQKPLNKRTAGVLIFARVIPNQTIFAGGFVKKCERALAKLRKSIRVFSLVNEPVLLHTLGVVNLHITWAGYLDNALQRNGFTLRVNNTTQRLVAALASLSSALGIQE